MNPEMRLPQASRIWGAGVLTPVGHSNLLGVYVFVFFFLNSDIRPCSYIYALHIYKDMALPLEGTGFPHRNAMEPTQQPKRHFQWSALTSPTAAG